MGYNVVRKKLPTGNNVESKNIEYASLFTTSPGHSTG
jgi:hypothetical protein